MEMLRKLEVWYKAQCNGEWENDYGITITTCNNSGWWVKIDLHGTPLQGHPFKRKSFNVSKQGHPIAKEWFDCYVTDNVFNGAGDVDKLEFVIRVFFDWAE